MAKEYIEREAVEQALIKEAACVLRAYRTSCMTVTDVMEKMIGVIQCFPAVDVAPVRRGEWIGVDTSYWRWYHDTARTVFSKSFRCSECGRKTIIREKFCPSCGAKMNKEEANE